MGNGLQAARALSVDSVKRGGHGKARVIQGHSTCLRKSKLRQDIADEHVLDVARLNASTCHRRSHHLSLCQLGFVAKQWDRRTGMRMSSGQASLKPPLKALVIGLRTAESSTISLGDLVASLPRSLAGDAIL
jgi:hypothetical protein